MGLVIVPGVDENVIGDAPVPDMNMAARSDKLDALAGVDADAAGVETGVPTDMEDGIDVGMEAGRAVDWLNGAVGMDGDVTAAPAALPPPPPLEYCPGAAYGLATARPLLNVGDAVAWAYC